MINATKVKLDLYYQIINGADRVRGTELVVVRDGMSGKKRERENGKERSGKLKCD